MDIANFSILNKASLFLIKLNKTALQSVPKITWNHFTKSFAQILIVIV